MWLGGTDGKRALIREGNVSGVMAVDRRGIVAWEEGEGIAVRGWRRHRMRGPLKERQHDNGVSGRTNGKSGEFKDDDADR